MGLNVLKDIRKIYAGLNADGIRTEAERSVNVGVLAPDPETYRRIEQFLAPPAADLTEQGRALRAVRPVHGAPSSQFDFIVCEPGMAVPRNGFTFESDDTGSLIRLILNEHQETEMALARTFPLFRAEVANRIIGRTARENALFSIVTALPDVIPNLMELPWAIGEFATDTAFLTMNQIRMALTLAAAYGRPVGYGAQKLEIAGIVASAFGWRAIARELVGKIPFGGGLIPKAAVAFAGTYVMGLGLDKINRTGSGLTRQERRDAYAEAFAKGRDAVRELRPGIAHTHEERLSAD